MERQVYDSPDKLWVPNNPAIEGPRAFYKPGEGNVNLSGIDFHFKIDEYDIPSEEGEDQKKFPTSKRVDLILKRYLDREPDQTVIILGGWGETSAEMAGDLLNEVITEMLNKGAQNPCIVLPNTGGRATKEFAELGKGSTTHFRDAMEDSKRLALRMHNEGLLGERVSIIGHSMGYMAAWPLIEGLAELKANNTRKDFDVVHLTGLMPATDKCLAGVRWRLLNAVKGQIGPSIVRYATKDSLDPTIGDYNAIMQGNRFHEDVETFRRTTPDSARVFLEWVLNYKRRALQNGAFQEMKVELFHGGKETFLPVSMAIDEAAYLRSKGAECGLRTLRELAHAVPFKMTPKQIAELRKHAQWFI